VWNPVASRLVAATDFTSSAVIVPWRTFTPCTSAVARAVWVPSWFVADAVVLTSPVSTKGSPLTEATVFEFVTGGVRVPHPPRVTTAVFPTFTA